MIINITIVGAAFLAFGGTDPSIAWLWLLAWAFLADIFNVMIKPIRVTIPVVGVVDKKPDELGGYL